MHSSDSEGFESADEGHPTPEKKERKKRISSSNASDYDSENVQKSVTPTEKCDNIIKENKIESTDGWDDFDIEEGEIAQQSNEKKLPETIAQTKKNKENEGWDDFDDWGQGEEISHNQKDLHKENNNKLLSTPPKPKQSVEPPKSSGWGWGWGVDSLLNTATAGISNLTTQVSQSISTVLETGIGAPDPEELAKRSAPENQSRNIGREEKADKEENKEQETRDINSETTFPFGNLFSGVTKFVETTGTKVIAGGLDTLETIGKKTMEVLQDGDPGLAKKRAMLGLDPNDKPVLSQVLREARAKADEEDRIKEEKREAKEVHYESLFDDFEGLVHLEAMEMLSRQQSMRIEERLRSAPPDKKQDLKETLQQVAELCEMPEEDDDDEDDEKLGDSAKDEVFHERLQTATQDLGLKLQFQPIVKHYQETLSWLTTADSAQPIYKHAVQSLAQCTALSMQIYHKAGEMLLTKTRRSTADEADALTQMTVVLTKHISELATLYTEKLNSLSVENKEQLNTYITNIFLEAGNSSTYIQNAFQLALPILQIGAV